LRRQDGVVEWEASGAVDIDRRVRALQPWPGVSAPLGGQRVRLLEGSPLDGGGTAAVPGTVIAMRGEEADMATASGTYRLTRVQPPGGRPMTTAAYLRGRRAGP
jgi:methionyl-tRNA formyltransferase